MKLIESNKFRKRGRGAEKILNSNPNLDDDTRKYLEIVKKQADTHRRIETASGLKLDVVQEGEPQNAAAFVEISAIKAGTRKANVVIKILNNPEQAMHAAKHEAMHIKSGITEIDLKEELTTEQLDAIYNKLGINEKDSVFLVEGFNELATISDHGRDSNCGYNDQEVPVAQRLEKLSKDYTGLSLLEAYKSGNRELFFDLFRKLADAILLEQARAEILKAA
ncbi:hypothetical protein ACFL10_01130 [Patescibacteria group bacterium]